MSFLKFTNGAAPGTPAAGLTELYVGADKRLRSIDADGTIVQFAAQPGAAAIVQSSPADPTGTAASAMMGLAASITPVATGRIHVTITGTIKNATAIADGANVQLRTGTGAAPANGDALTGTARGGLVKYVAATTAQKVPFTVCAIVTGLALATAVWLDLGLAAVTGGTAEVTDLSVTAFEF